MIVTSDCDRMLANGSLPHAGSQQPDPTLRENQIVPQQQYVIINSPMFAVKRSRKVKYSEANINSVKG